jgi:tRNA-intron lyase
MQDYETVRHDLEARGWLVRDGALYGGDFVLYQREQEYHTHSLYLVKIDTNLNYRELLSVIRIANSVCKKLLIAQVNGSRVKYVSITSK